MKTENIDRKAELRSLVLDLLLGEKRPSEKLDTFERLRMAAAPFLSNKARSGSANLSVFHQAERLPQLDTESLMEIFWDLVVEKVITIGIDPDNQGFPYFRLHSSVRNKKRCEVN